MIPKVGDRVRSRYGDDLTRHTRTGGGSGCRGTVTSVNEVTGVAVVRFDDKTILRFHLPDAVCRGAKDAGLPNFRISCEILNVLELMAEAVREKA